MNISLLLQKLEEDGFSEAEIDSRVEVLERIYIGQNVRSQGILQFDLQDREDEIATLSEYSLIEEERWYSHQVLRTTEEGEEAAGDIIRERVDDRVEHVPSSLDYEGPIIGFLLHDYLNEKNAFPKHERRVRDWKSSLLEEDRVWSARNQLFDSLLNQDLAVEAHHYVSTRGGERRGVRYVIPDEVRRALKNQVWPEYESGLDQEMRWKCEAYLMLVDAPNYLSVEHLEYSRETFWNRLEDASFEESFIEGIINELSDAGATTSYRGLLNDSLPFEILDESKFQIALKEHLIKPVESQLFEDASGETSGIEILRETGHSADEIEILEKLAEIDDSPFDIQEEAIQHQLEKAVELYKDSYWSEFLLRINNVCEVLIRELYQQRATEYSEDIENLLEGKHRSRIEAIGNFSFISEHDPLRHRLLSIHLDRINSDAPHGGESEIITERDARRTVHDFLEIYISIWQLLE